MTTSCVIIEVGKVIWIQSKRSTSDQQLSVELFTHKPDFVLSTAFPEHPVPSGPRNIFFLMWPRESITCNG